MQNEDTKKKLLTVKDTAKFFDVSEKTVYRWATAGTIPHIRVGDQYRFSSDELIAWGQTTGKRIPPELIHEPKIDLKLLPSLTQAISNGGIYYQVSGENPKEVIEEAVSIIRLPQNVDRKYICDLLLARESLASTGIGDGVAVPHIRHSIKEIEVPQISLCLLSTPVDWNAIDGKPVEIVFIPCCPNMRTHLHLLSRISYAVSHTSWTELLRKQAIRREIISALENIEKEFFRHN